MDGGTIFIGGIYGVGKSTICKKLSDALCIPMFSAGDLISEVNGEQYGANKAVHDANSNQKILTEQVESILNKHKTIILAGHFCIFDKFNKVEYLPESIFTRLRINQIVLLTADIEEISNNLKLRDGKQYAVDDLQILLNSERQQAEMTAKSLHCPILEYRMKFDDNDAERLMQIIKPGVCDESSS